MLDYSDNQMLEQITRIRRALVDIAASRKQIELQESQLQTRGPPNDQAKTALGAGPGGPGPRGAVEEGARPRPRSTAWSRSARAHRGRGEAGARAGRAAEAGEQLPLAEGSPQGPVHRRERDQRGQRGRGGHRPASATPAPRSTRPGQDLTMQARAGARTSCSSPACSRTSAAAAMTSRKNSTRSPRQATWTTSSPPSRRAWPGNAAAPRPPGRLTRPLFDAAARRSTTSAMRAARTSGRRVVA